MTPIITAHSVAYDIVVLSRQDTMLVYEQYFQYRFPRVFDVE